MQTYLQELSPEQLDPVVWTHVWDYELHVRYLEQ